MPKRIIKVLKTMGTGLEAANTNGAMNSTEQKKRILLGQKERLLKNLRLKISSRF